MPKYTDINRAVQNYISFGNRWERIQKDFNEFSEHIDNLEKLGIKGIVITRPEDKKRIEISAYGRNFSVQLFPQVVEESIRGFAIFFENLPDGSTRDIKKFAVDGGYISELDQSDTLPAYDATSLQLRYWLNLIDFALSSEPQLLAHKS